MTRKIFILSILLIATVSLQAQHKDLKKLFNTCKDDPGFTLKIFDKSFLIQEKDKIKLQVIRFKIKDIGIRFGDFSENIIQNFSENILNWSCQILAVDEKYCVRQDYTYEKMLIYCQSAMNMRLDHEVLYQSVVTE